jgi:hypothetical protein
MTPSTSSTATPATREAARNRTDGRPREATAGTGASEFARAGTDLDIEISTSAAKGHSRQVVMVVEIHDAHRRRPEGDGAWIDTFGSAVVDASQTINAYEGDLVAVLGTRLVASFAIERVAAAFEAAITLHRRAAKAAETAGGWLCSIGVATGDVIDVGALSSIDVPLVGNVIDRALMLCSWAQAGAFLADERSVMPALVETEPDQRPAPDRTWSLGANRVLVGNDNDTVEFWDVVFDRLGATDLPRPAGKRSASASGRATKARNDRERSRPARGDRPLDPARNRLAEMADPTVSGPARRAALGGRRTWSDGTVCCWFGDRGRGVIASNTGQEFYVDRRFLVTGVDLPADATVFFVPRDPMSSGRNPVAGAVLVAGARIEVRVEHVDERGFGFAELGDAQGTKQLVMLDLTADDVAVNAGDWLLVEVRALESGPVAVPV